jgi:hypothetical protein
LPSLSSYGGPGEPDQSTVNATADPGDAALA